MAKQQTDTSGPGGRCYTGGVFPPVIAGTDAIARVSWRPGDLSGLPRRHRRVGHDGTEREQLNLNEVFGGLNCFGLGPNMAETPRRSDVPVMYALFVPGATQMWCPDGSRRHDMVLTAVPGDPGYQPAVRVVRCTPGPSWTNPAIGPAFSYTSATEVQAAIASGKVTCGAPSLVLMAPVVGRPTAGE